MPLDPSIRFLFDKPLHAPNFLPWVYGDWSGDSHNADGFSAVENEGYYLSSNRDGVVSVVGRQRGK